MRLIHIPLAAAAFYLGLSVSIAPAQQQNQPPDTGQQLRAPTDPQGHDPVKSQQGGKEEPSSQANAKSAAPNETDVFVDGKLAVPGAPADSQTVPAKFSERNARLDKLPIMALPLGLSDEQKHRIAASVAKSDAPVSQISAKPADVLPADTPVSELSADVKASVPAASGLRFIRTREKIYLVLASNMVVREEIAVN